MLEEASRLLPLQWARYTNLGRKAHQDLREANTRRTIKKAGTNTAGVGMATVQGGDCWEVADGRSPWLRRTTRRVRCIAYCRLADLADKGCGV